MSWAEVRSRAGQVDRGLWADLAWVAFSLLMCWVMVYVPSQQTLPYHLIFVSFTVLYGYRLWAGWVTNLSLIAVTAVTGFVFFLMLRAGQVTLDEVTEVPMMPLLVGAMAWHARRAAEASRKVARLAAREAGRTERQREFLRDTSHSIRTPVTVARGHVELLLLSAGSTQQAEDVKEILHQLDRLAGFADRLLAIEQLDTVVGPEPRPVDVAGLAGVHARQWQHAAARRWVLDCVPAGMTMGDPARLEEALDALIENALKVTHAGDTVRVSTRPDPDGIVVEVADSGPGVPIEEREKVFDRFYCRPRRPGQEPGTGLGLALVAAVARSHEGSVSVGTAPEGGAVFRLVLPLAEVAGPQVDDLVTSTEPGLTATS